MFCRSLFVHLYLFFWPLCCLFFFDIRFWLPPFGIFKLFLNHLAFRCFDYERIWWALFQKRVVFAYKVFFDFIIIDSNQDLNLRLISHMYWKPYPILVINWNQDYLLYKRDRRGRDRMVVWHSVRITTNVVSSNPGVLVTTLCDKVCQVNGFLQVVRFPPRITLTATI